MLYVDQAAFAAAREAVLVCFFNASSEETARVNLDGVPLALLRALNECADTPVAVRDQVAA